MCAITLRRALRFDRPRLSLFASLMQLNAKALLSAIVLAACSTAHAQLTWEKTQIDLHPKVGEQEAVAVFKYENKGKTTVNIKNVRSSCGCTVPALKKNEVAPGEKGELTATFKIGGRTGVQQKTVTVETDHPEQPMTNLILQATIAQALEIVPSFVFWEKGEAVKPKQIKVKASKDVNVTKLDVSSSSPDFTTKVEKGSGAGEFVINVAPRATDIPLAATLTIKPDFDQVFYATARVTGPAAAGR
jgi:hypothetical protein